MITLKERNIWALKNNKSIFYFKITIAKAVSVVSVENQCYQGYYKCRTLAHPYQHFKYALLKYSTLNPHLLVICDQSKNASHFVVQWLLENTPLLWWKTTFQNSTIQGGEVKRAGENPEPQDQWMLWRYPSKHLLISLVG